MLEKFLKQTKFSSQEDFIKNFRINVPENFNFGYDVVDEWARIAPEKKALCWTNEQDHHIDFTFADIKRESDKTAAFFLSLGIKRGDMVMLILKRRYEFWSRSSPCIKSAQYVSRQPICLPRKTSYTVAMPPI